LIKNNTIITIVLKRHKLVKGAIIKYSQKFKESLSSQTPHKGQTWRNATFSSSKPKQMDDSI